MTAKFNSIVSAVTAIAFTCLTTMPAAAQSADLRQLNAYDTASLQQFTASLSTDSSFESALSGQQNRQIGLGLGYTLKFGENVAASEKYGKAALNFNTTWRGQTGSAPLAALSFGEQEYLGYDRFSLSAPSAEGGTLVKFEVLGFDVNRLNADDDGKKEKSGTDLGDVGLAAGGIGILLFGGTIAILAIEN